MCPYFVRRPLSVRPLVSPEMSLEREPSVVRDRFEVVVVDYSSHRGSIHEDTRSIRVTRRSVYIYIGITLIILTVLFTLLVVFVFPF